MMAEANIDGIFAALKKRGFSDQKADLYAGLIGDVIETSPDGKWTIRDETGSELDRIEPVQFAS